MSPTVKHADLQRLLYKAKPKVRKAILANADPSVIRSICECCYNVLKGNVPMSKSQKARLRRYKNTLRFMVDRSRGLQQKKKRIVVQQGGFLPALLAPIIGGVLSSLILPK